VPWGKKLFFKKFTQVHELLYEMFELVMYESSKNEGLLDLLPKYLKTQYEIVVFGFLKLKSVIR